MNIKNKKIIDMIALIVFLIGIMVISIVRNTFGDESIAFGILVIVIGIAWAIVGIVSDAGKKTLILDKKGIMWIIAGIIFVLRGIAQVALKIAMVTGFYEVLNIITITAITAAVIVLCIIYYRKFKADEKS